MGVSEMKNDWNLKIQNYLTVGLVATIGLSIISIYKEWIVPVPYFYFVVTLISVGLLIVHVVQRQFNRKKEIVLIASILFSLTLWISSLAYYDWKWDDFVNGAALSKIAIVLLGIIDLYLTVAYYRTKIAYKKVRGNQKYNRKWRTTKKQLRKNEQSDDIYLNLGYQYDNPDNTKG